MRKLTNIALRGIDVENIVLGVAPGEESLRWTLGFLRASRASFGRKAESRHRSARKLVRVNKEERVLLA